VLVGMQLKFMILQQKLRHSDFQRSSELTLLTGILVLFCASTFDFNISVEARPALCI